MLSLILIVLVCFRTEQIPLVEITDVIAGYSYLGEWESQLQNPFNYLDGVDGQSKIMFITNQTNNYKEEIVTITQLGILLLDPKYMEQKVVEGLIDLENYDENTLYYTSLLQDHGLAKASLITRHDKIVDQCKVSYEISIKFPLGHKPLHSNAKISLKILSNFIEDCAVDLEGTYSLDTTNYSLQVLIYCLLTNVICTIQYICVTRLCRNLLLTDFQNLSRISLYCVGFVTAYDTCLCLQNFNYALLNYFYFQYFIIPSFFYLLLSFTCDMKLFWILWRYTYADQLQDLAQERKYYARFFLIFYSTTIVLYLVMRTLSIYNWFMLLLALFIIPQIVHNIKQGNNPQFIPEYIFGFLLPNIVEPLYFRTDPNNFRGLQPSIWFSCLWILLFCIQISILFIQYKFGPMWIIPKCLLPKQYNYYQIYTSTQEDNDCAICLGNLLMEPEQIEHDLGATLLEKKIMVTPCAHKFHISCLKGWMDVKLSCPTCRKDIPAIVE